MPYQLIRERYFTPQSQRSAFAQHATFFQDLVIRCVRYAFAHIPASIGRVFFSKAVALPFFTFRKLRHGVLRSDVHWHEVSQVRFSPFPSLILPLLLLLLFEGRADERYTG